MRFTVHLEGTLDADNAKDAARKVAEHWTLVAETFDDDETISSDAFDRLADEQHFGAGFNAELRPVDS